jgi:HSP90 family molecular chaperone
MKQIQVKVQSDHLERMTKVRSPIHAVAELIWNALDADATEVRVNVTTGFLGGIETITISDNGHGIDYLQAEPAFSNLGGSWKRGIQQSTNKRRMHGKAGQGRFRAFSLGDQIEWRSAYKKNKRTFTYTIEGKSSTLGTFNIGDEKPSRNSTGTAVHIDDITKNVGSLLNDKAHQELTEQFALYLRQYPDITVWYLDKKIDPADIERQSDDYPLNSITLPSGRHVDAVNCN